MYSLSCQNNGKIIIENVPNDATKAAVENISQNIMLEYKFSM
jgi:hypothetical protein